MKKGNGLCSVLKRHLLSPQQKAEVRRSCKVSVALKIHALVEMILHSNNGTPKNVRTLLADVICKEILN